MDRFQERQTHGPERPSESLYREDAGRFESSQTVYTAESNLRAEEISRRYERVYSKKWSRRRWAGAGLSLLGLAVITSSCPFYAVSLIGPHTILAGLGFLVAGAWFMITRPKIKDTNRALMVALKYGNVLTVTRLALELDVSLEKAEKIIHELVKSGIAEIDLDHKDATDALVYRVKGL